VFALVTLSSRVLVRYSTAVGVLFQPELQLSSVRASLVA
jgi:hypothetical protein